MGFIDPHGDVAEELLDCIPPHRTDDVAYFNPADLEYPVGLNPLQKTPRDRHHLVVDSIISTLKSIWGDVWGMNCGLATVSPSWCLPRRFLLHPPLAERITIPTAVTEEVVFSRENEPALRRVYSP